MNTSVPKNSWVVDSTNKLGNRPDGEPWNDTFPSIIDFDEDACLERILNEGGSEEEGLAMWAAQIQSATAVEMIEYRMFVVAICDHETEILDAEMAAEDIAYQLQKMADEKLAEVKAKRLRKANGETAEIRATATTSISRVPALTPASASFIFGQPSNQLLGAPIGGTMNSNRSVDMMGNMKRHITVDGVDVWTDAKAASVVIGGNLTLYRTFEPDRLKRCMDPSGIIWLLETNLLILAEDRQALEDKPVVLETDPDYALTFWADIKSNPGFVNRIMLERLIRMQFRVTDNESLHYLHFYPLQKSATKQCIL